MSDAIESARKLITDRLARSRPRPASCGERSRSWGRGTAPRRRPEAAPQTGTRQTAPPAGAPRPAPRAAAGGDRGQARRPAVRARRRDRDLPEPGLGLDRRARKDKLVVKQGAGYALKK